MAERWVIGRGGDAPLVLPLTAPWGAMVTEITTPTPGRRVTYAERREGAVVANRGVENVDVVLRVSITPPRDAWRTETHTFAGAPAEAEGDGALPGWTGPTRRATAGSASRAMIEDIQAAVARLGSEGGTLTRVFDGGKALTYTVLSAGITDGPAWDLAWYVAQHTTLTLAFTCLPYALGDEQQIATGALAAGNRAVTLTGLQIPGDVPALGRVVFSGAAVAQKSLVVAVDQPDTATQAAGVELAATSRERPAGGTAGALAGSTSAQVLTVSATSAAWTPHLGLRALADGARLDVRGTYRVWLRLRGGGGTSRVRLRWTSGTIESGTTTNTPAELPTAAGWVLADLGTVTIPDGGRLDGVIDRIQGGGCSYDRLLLVPAVVHARAYALTGTADQVLHPGRTAQMDHRAATRQVADGRSGQVAATTGDWITLPPSGRAARPVRVVAAVGRDDWRTGVDSTSGDAVTVTVHARPRWLLVPGGSS